MKPWQDESLAANGRSVQENFSEWFGDSKVVDAEGQPLVVYHGTNKDFDAFDIERGNEIGSHFGSAEQADKATHYWLAKKKPAGVKIMPVYLSIKNPLRLKDNGYFGAVAVEPQLKNLGIPVKDGDVRQSIIDAGYDGVVYENEREGTGDSWIVLHPKQIKSALGNSGLFLKHSASISDHEEVLRLQNVERARRSLPRSSARELCL